MCLLQGKMVRQVEGNAAVEKQEGSQNMGAFELVLVMRRSSLGGCGRGIGRVNRITWAGQRDHG